MGGVNFAPTATNPGDQTDSVGAVVDLQLVASDPEGDNLSFAAINLPPGLSISAATGVISGTLVAGGQYNSEIQISDGESVTALSFVWRVIDPNLPANVALGAVVSQSSTLVSAVDLGAHKAVDGNRSGDFGVGSITHTGFDAQAWWEVDLGASYDLSAVRIYNREDCCAESLQDFYVLVSEVPFTSQELTTTIAQSGVTSTFVAGIAGQEALVNLSRRGRYLRVQLSGSDYLQLAEVEVLGGD